MKGTVMATRISGRYDASTGEERPGDWLSDTHGEALVYVLSLDRPAKPVDLGRDLAHDGQGTSASATHSRGYALLRVLVAHGLVRSPSWGTYEPTERGRIVAVLHMARRPGMAEAFFDGMEGPAPARVEAAPSARDTALAKLRPAFSALTPRERRALGRSLPLSVVA